MNLERLNKIIDIYIDKFEMLTNDECDENMKWRAMYHFKNNFDINAPDFHEMFKYAMSESNIIINNGTVQPVNGILKLIRLRMKPSSFISYLKKMELARSRLNRSQMRIWNI